MNWKVLASKFALKNSFFTIEEDKCQKTDGTVVEKYYTIHRPDAAVIAAFTEKMELILIDQYRHPVKSVDIELPAGYIEKSEKNMEQAAKRELLEETGYKVDKLIKLQACHASAGLMSNNLHFFIAFDAKKVQEPQLDQNEEIKVRITPWNKVPQLLKEERIKDMASVAGILMVEKYLQAS